MIITVPYGTGSISAALPDSIRVDIVSPECARLVGSDDERIEEALNNPIGTSRLEEMVLPQDRVLIIVNDHTRPGPNRKMCTDCCLGWLKRVSVTAISALSVPRAPIAPLRTRKCAVSSGTM